jgi:hypothetical protein
MGIHRHSTTATDQFMLSSDASRSSRTGQAKRSRCSLTAAPRCCRAWQARPAAHWARSHADDIIQHSFWLFDTEENARTAEATFHQLRDMTDAPATFVSVDVCQVVCQA